MVSSDIWPFRSLPDSDPIKLITPVRSFSLSTILLFSRVSPQCDHLAAQPLEHIAVEIDETLETKRQHSRRIGYLVTSIEGS
jgi:hypothetical protein